VSGLKFTQHDTNTRQQLRSRLPRSLLSAHCAAAGWCLYLAIWEGKVQNLHLIYYNSLKVEEQ
jgi:hypothetical protein